MVVASPRDEQPVLVSQALQGAAVPPSQSRSNRLQPIQTGSQQGSKMRVDRVERGMSPRTQPAGLPRQADRRRHLKVHQGDLAQAAAGKAVKGVRHVPGVPGGHQRPRQMDPGQRPIPRPGRRVWRGNSREPQRIGRLLVAVRAGLAEADEQSPEHGRHRAGKVHQDVKLAPGDTTRDFSRVNHSNGASPDPVMAMGQRRRTVVIGQGDDIQASIGRTPHQLLGIQATVATRCVEVEVKTRPRR